MGEEKGRETSNLSRHCEHFYVLISIAHSQRVPQHNCRPDLALTWNPRVEL